MPPADSTATTSTETADSAERETSEQAGDRMRDEAAPAPGTRPASTDRGSTSTADDALPALTITDEASTPGEGTTTTDEGATDTTEAAPEPEAPTLDEETVRRYAEELHGAINRDGGIFGSSDDPDVDKITDILDSLNAADRQAIEEAYVDVEDNGDHRSLRTELEDNLDGDDWRKIEAILNREDGRTNDAGNLIVSLAAINDDRGDAERRVIETFATLNSDQMAQLEQDLQEDYGLTVEEAFDEYDVSDEARTAIDFVRKPIDQRTAQDIEDFARFAVEEENLDYLAVALRGDTPAAQEARRNLQNDQQFNEDLVEAFKPEEEHGGGFGGFVRGLADTALGPVDEIVGGIIEGDLSWQDVVGGLPIVEQFVDLIAAVDAKEENIELLQAMDILREGRVSLATIALNNSGSLFGWFDNQDNIGLAVENATETERQAFQQGRAIIDEGREPTTDEERNAVEFYNRVHNAFEESGNESESAQWEDQLLTGGSIIGELAAADSGNDRFTALENISEEDWQRLTSEETGPEFRAQIEDYLNEFSDGEERTRLLEILDGKAGAATFEESQQVRRSLFEVIDQNDGHDFLWFGTDYDGANIVPAIAALTPEEASQYQSDSGFRQRVDDFVDENLEGAEQAYAHRLLSQVAETGAPPEIGPIETVLENEIYDADAQASLPAIEAALQDEDLRNRLAGDDLSDDDQAILNAIRGTVRSAAGDAGLLYGEQGNDPSEQYIDELLSTGTLSLASRIDLDLKDRTFYQLVGSASESERAALDLNEDEQQLVNNIAAQGGEMTLADDIRSFVIGDGRSYEDFEQPLSELSNAELQQLRDEYAQKYGVLDEDFLGAVDDSDRNNYRTLLTAGNVDGRQDFYDNLEAMLHSQSGFSPDGTELTLERSVGDQAALLGEFQARFEQLPPEVQQQANQYFAEAIEDYQESKEAFAEKLYQAAVLIGGLAVGIATGGVTLPALLAVAAVAAAGRVALNRVVQGEDYDTSLGNVLQDVAIGAATGALSVVGPETIAAFRGVGTAVAGRFAASRITTELGETLVSQSLREGGERIVARELDTLVARAVVRGEPISDQALLQVARRAAAEGVDARTLVPALRTATEAGGREVAEGAIRSTLSANAREVGAWATIGGTSNVGIESTVGIVNGNLDLSHLPQSFLFGAAAGGGLAIAFKGAGSALAHLRATPDGTLHASTAEGDPPLQLEAHLSDGTTQPVTLTEDGVVLPPGTEALGVPGQPVTDVQVRAVDSAPIRGEDGRYYLREGDELVPLEFGAGPRSSRADAPPYHIEDVNGLNRLHIGDQSYDLTPGFFQFPAGRPHSVESPVKVHVTIEDADALRRIQEVLIPALEGDPQLAQLVPLWKTINPQYAFGADASPYVLGQGQAAKGFTIYANTPADAQVIAQRIDQILTDSGLAIPRPLETGNVDGILPGSNRVGIVRDVFPRSVSSTDHAPLAVLDSSLQRTIERDFANSWSAAHPDSQPLVPGEPLPAPVLRDLETFAGLRQDSLSYDAEGNLVIAVSSNREYLGGLYATEAGAGKEFGQLTDRPAIYSLYERFGLSPASDLIATTPRTPLDANFVPQSSEGFPAAQNPSSLLVNGESVTPNQVLTVGRNPDSNIRIRQEENLVSREHAYVYTDGQGNTYVADAGSTNGTYVNGYRLPTGTPEQPNWHLLRPEDRVTLGHEGPQLRFAHTSDASLPARAPSYEAVAQSNRFANTHEEVGRLEDGWQNTGQNQFTNPDGSFNSSQRVALVVDRQADTVLANTIQDASARFGHVQPPQLRAEMLSRYVQDLLTPNNLSSSQLDNWYAGFLAQHAGERVMLGQFIQAGRGACNQQATLFKVLADEVFRDLPNVQVRLIRGNGSDGSNVIDHTWATVDFGDGRQLIYDSRQGVFGASAAGSPNYRPGSEIEQALKRGDNAVTELNLREGDEVEWSETPGWRFRGYDADGDAILSHDGFRLINHQEVLALNPNLQGIQPGHPSLVGHSFNIRRSDGTIEQWRLDGINPNGQYMFSRRDAVVITVSRRDLQQAA